MNRRRSKSRPLSVVPHCNTSPILHSSRPSSACSSSAMTHCQSFSFSWQDTNNNSNYIDHKSQPWNNFRITELNHSPTNFRRKIFTLASPTESPVLSPTAESPVLPPTSESQPLPPASESPAFPTTSEPQALPTTSEPQAFPTTSEPQAFPTTSESPVPSESQSELSMQSLVHTPVHSPSPSPVSSRKSSSDGGDSKSNSPQSTPILNNQRGSLERCSSPLSEYSSLNKFTDLVSKDSFSTSCSSCTTNDRRYMVIGEIISTERKYICNLEVLLNGYLPALEHAVAPRDLRLLFPAQLEPMMEKHKDLLTKLESRVSENSLFPDIVGDIFARLCDTNSEFLNIYSAYLNEFKVAVKTLAKYEQTSSQFRELLSLCQHTPFCEGLSLASYLLTPVQRLPRYELLLKELLKHTPMDHPDNYYVGDAIDKLHEEMIRLNQSIKSCQLACSVRRVQRRKSFRFTKGVRRSNTRISLATQLKRHVSTTNISDISLGSGDPCLYQSEESLDVAMRRNGRELVQTDDEGLDYNSSSLMTGRAISCSDLLFDIERPKSFRNGHLGTLDSIPSTPEPPKLTSSPILAIRRNAALIGEEGVRSRSRLSTYSTASSTSGIGSIDQSQLDLTGRSMTPTEQNQQGNPLCSSTPICTTKVPLVNSFLATIQQQMALASIHEDRPSLGRSKPTPGRKMSWANFRLPRKLKKGSRSASLSQIIDISAPMDFRHIQHGYSPSDLTPTNSNPLMQSPTITDSNPGSNNTLTPK